MRSWSIFAFLFFLSFVILFFSFSLSPSRESSLREVTFSTSKVILNTSHSYDYDSNLSNDTNSSIILSNLSDSNLTYYRELRKQTNQSFVVRLPEEVASRSRGQIIG